MSADEFDFCKIIYMLVRPQAEPWGTQFAGTFRWMHYWSNRKKKAPMAGYEPTTIDLEVSDWSCKHFVTLLHFNEKGIDSFNNIIQMIC